MKNGNLKKMLSTLLATTTILVFSGISVCAAPINNNSEIQNTKFELTNVNGESQLSNSITKSDKTTIETIGNINTIATIDKDSVSVNGTKVIEVTKTNVPSVENKTPVVNTKSDGVKLDTTIQPQATFNWSYVASCPYGTSSNYNVSISKTVSNVKLSNVISAMTISLLTSALLALCKVQGVANAVASALVGGVTATTDSTCVYYIQYVWGYSGMTNFYREYDQYWYYDSDYTKFVYKSRFYAVNG